MLHWRFIQGWQAEGHPHAPAEGFAESPDRAAEGGISRSHHSWPQRVRRQGLPLLRRKEGIWGVKTNNPVGAKASYFKAFALTGRLFITPYYPGRCPGLGASALSGRIT